jgi:hypothetical protein
MCRSREMRRSGRRGRDVTAAGERAIGGVELARGDIESVGADIESVVGVGAGLVETVEDPPTPSFRVEPARRSLERLEWTSTQHNTQRKIL